MKHIDPGSIWTVFAHVATFFGFWFVDVPSFLDRVTGAQPPTEELEETTTVTRTETETRTTRRVRRRRP